MIPLALGAFAAALFGGPHCVGMCGPFASAAGPTWHAGRLVTYVSLGALAGTAGVAPFLDGTLIAVISALLLTWFAARLAGWAPAWRAPGVARLGTALLRKGGFTGHFGFGVASGLLPCGLVWSALAMAVPAGSAWGGSAIMATFWVGTLPALSLASAALRRLAATRPWTRRAVAAAVLVSGLVAIGMRAEATPAGPSCHEATP